MNGDSKRISYEADCFFRAGTKGNFDCIKQCKVYAKRRFLCVSVFDRVIMFVNTLRPRQNGCQFPDIFKCIFLNENIYMSINTSLKFVPKGPINIIPALVQIMAWCRTGDKPLSEPMMVCLLTHICVTRPEWVNTCFPMQVREYNSNALHALYTRLSVNYTNYLLGNQHEFFIIKWVLITPQCHQENLSSNPNSKKDKHRIFWFENQPLPLPWYTVILIVFSRFNIYR